MTPTIDEIKRLVPEAKLIPWPHKDETGPDTWHIGIYCVGEKDRPETYPYTFRMLLTTRRQLEIAVEALENVTGKPHCAIDGMGLIMTASDAVDMIRISSKALVEINNVGGS